MGRMIALVRRVRRINDDIYLAKFVLKRMTGNPLFTSPPVPLATVAADIAALDAAQAHTLTRAAAAASTRNHLFAVVWGDLQRLRAYVQRIADGSPETAAVVIASAGMDVKRSSGHGRTRFKARGGPNPGSVSLLAERERTRASYEWQVSLDGVNWVTALWTVKASAVLRGLKEQTRYYFRMRSVTNAGTGDFGQVITFVVP